MNGGPVFSLAGLLLLAVTEAATADLVAFLPRADSAISHERALREDPALAGLGITVVLRWRAFAEAMATSPAAIAVAPSGILLDSGWTPLRQGLRNGEDHERQSLVAIDGAVDLAGLTRRTVALVQESQREQGLAWLTGAYPDLPRDLTVRPVARPEDLLQVLGLDLAGAAVLTAAQTTAARERFPGSLKVLAHSRPLRLMVVACRAPGTAARAQILDRLGQPALEALGLTGFAPFTGPAVPWP